MALVPFLCFNVVVLVGTITEGGHNLADVVGGSLFAVAAIAVTERLRCSDIASHMAEAAHRAVASFRMAPQQGARDPRSLHPAARLNAKPRESRLQAALLLWKQPPS